MSAGENANEPGTSDLAGSDAGTKGTGSAGRSAPATGEGSDAGTKGTGSAGRGAPGSDAGTKGTGSAG